jgi:hypothetical protein
MGLISLGVSLVVRTPPRTAPVLHNFGDLPHFRSRPGYAAAQARYRARLRRRLLRAKRRKRRQPALLSKKTANRR